MSSSAGRKAGEGKSARRAAAKPAARIAFCLFILALVLLFFAFGYSFAPRSGTSVGEQAIPADAGRGGFRDCQILRESCPRGGCDLVYLCGNDTYGQCRIYDCGKDYGIDVTDTAGAESRSRRAKYDPGAVTAKKEACSGSMQVLETECADGATRIKVKIASRGECRIGGFTVAEDGKDRQENEFEATGDGGYVIKLKGCPAVTKIVPQTEEGIAIY